MPGKSQREAIQEYLRRMTEIDAQISALREDRKQLNEDYKEVIDLKTLNKVLRIQKIQDSVEDKDRPTFDDMLDLLTAELSRATLRRVS